MFLQCNSKMLFCRFWIVPNRLCLCFGFEGCWSPLVWIIFVQPHYMWQLFKSMSQDFATVNMFFFWVLLSLFLSSHLFLAASVFSLREVQLQKDPGHRSSVFHPLGKLVSYRLTELFHTASFSEVIIIRSHYYRVTVHRPGVPKLDIQWSKSDF